MDRGGEYKLVSDFWSDLSVKRASLGTFEFP